MFGRQEDFASVEAFKEKVRFGSIYFGNAKFAGGDIDVSDSSLWRVSGAAVGDGSEEVILMRSE
jgi:hypothetical protein